MASCKIQTIIAWATLTVLVFDSAFPNASVSRSWSPRRIERPFNLQGCVSGSNESLHNTLTPQALNLKKLWTQPCSSTIHPSTRGVPHLLLDISLSRARHLDYTSNYIQVLRHVAYKFLASLHTDEIRLRGQFYVSYNALRRLLR
jgi:hypothetical protein